MLARLEGEFKVNSYPMKSGRMLKVKTLTRYQFYVIAKHSRALQRMECRFMKDVAFIVEQGDQIRVYGDHHLHLFSQ